MATALACGVVFVEADLDVAEEGGSRRQRIWAGVFYADFVEMSVSILANLAVVDLASSLFGEADLAEGLSNYFSCGRQKTDGARISLAAAREILTIHFSPSGKKRPTELRSPWLSPGRSSQYTIFTSGQEKTDRSWSRILAVVAEADFASAISKSLFLCRTFFPCG